MNSTWYLSGESWTIVSEDSSMLGYDNHQVSGCQILEHCQESVNNIVPYPRTPDTSETLLWET